MMVWLLSSVQLLSHVQLFATPWIAARQASLSIINSRSSLKLTSIESVMPSSYLIPCHPLFLLPPIPPSIRVFSNESTLCMRRPKYWSFSFSIIPSKEHPGLISFRMDSPRVRHPRVRHPGVWSQRGLRSITMNKASGGDRIPVELFQILKDDAVKVLHSVCQKIWKTQQWPQDWKRSVFISFFRKERQCQRMFKLSHSCSHLTR